MFIFSKIRNAKKGANEHKRSASLSPESKAEGKKPVYHHAPAHAAHDALVASVNESPDSIQKIQDQQRRSKTMPMQTGSDMYLQQGSKIPLRQRSAGDLSMQSGMGTKHASKSTLSFQPDEDEIPNPYGFHPHSKRGSGSGKSSRRNSAISARKGKSPLSNRISVEEIPELPLESLPESSSHAMKSTFISSSKFKESLPVEHYQSSQGPQKSSLKVQSSATRPVSSKGRVIFDFDQLDKYDEEFNTVPTVLVPNNSLTPEYDGRSGASEKGRLSPIPQSPLFTDPFSQRTLHRLTLNMKIDEDDWFTQFSKIESASKIEDIVESTVETTLLVNRISGGPSTPAFALEQDLSLICNVDFGADVHAFEEIEEEFWKLSTQHEQHEQNKLAEPLETFIENDAHIETNAPAYPEGVIEGLSRPPYPAEDSWIPQWGPDALNKDGTNVLTFAQQLRKQSRQSAQTIWTITTPEKQRHTTNLQAFKPKCQQEHYQKHHRAEESWYQSPDSGMRFIDEDEEDNESPFGSRPTRYTISSPTKSPTAKQSTFLIDPISFHHDRPRVPKALSLRSPHATPSPERQPQYNVLPSPTHGTSNGQWKNPPPDYKLSPPKKERNFSTTSDWLPDDEEMWPIITHEPQVHALEQRPQIVQETHYPASVKDVSPLDEVPPVLYPVGQVPESYGHARTISSSTALSASSGRDRLRFPSRESSQRIRTTSHTSYETWLSGRTESPTPSDPLSPQYEHTVTNWGPTNSPMCIPEVKLPSVAQQYARFNDPASIQNLYENVISPSPRILPQRSMPNLKASQPSTALVSPPPLPTRSQSFTRLSSPPANLTVLRSHSRGASPTNFKPPRASILERPFLLQDPGPMMVPEKQFHTLREETPLVTILDPFSEEEKKRSPNKLVKKKPSRMFSMWGRKNSDRATAAVAAY